MHRLEGLPGGVLVAIEGHVECRVRSVIPQVQLGSRLRCFGWHALFGKLVEDGRAQLVRQGGDGLAAGCAKGPHKPLLAAGGHRGKAHPIGRQEAGQGMQQDMLHAQRIGNEAGVLSTRAAERIQQIARHVVAALNADLLDGIGHVFDGDGQEAFRHLLGRAPFAGRGGDFGELLGDRLAVEGLVLPRAEDRGKISRIELAKHHVGVGHGQRAAAPISRRARVGAGGIRPDAEAPLFGMQDGASAGGHRMDAHHRGADPHSGDFGVEGALILAGRMGDIGRGAAHVETDDA